MKKWFLLLMPALCIPFAAQAADWREITGAGVYGDTTVTLGGEGVYLFDGGTLENVSVGTGALQGEHFQFFGVTFTGDAVVLAARNDRQCQVWFAADCVDQTRQGVRVIAENTDPSGYDEEEREWRFDTQIIADVSCGVNGLTVESVHDGLGGKQRTRSAGSYAHSCAGSPARAAAHRRFPSPHALCSADGAERRLHRHDDEKTQSRITHVPASAMEAGADFVRRRTRRRAPPC